MNFPTSYGRDPRPSPLFSFARQSFGRMATHWKLLSQGGERDFRVGVYRWLLAAGSGATYWNFCPAKLGRTGRSSLQISFDRLCTRPRVSPLRSIRSRAFTRLSSGVRAHTFGQRRGAACAAVSSLFIRFHVLFYFGRNSDGIGSLVTKFCNSI